MHMNVFGTYFIELQNKYKALKCLVVITTLTNACN